MFDPIHDVLPLMFDEFKTPYTTLFLCPLISQYLLRAYHNIIALSGAEVQKIRLIAPFISSQFSAYFEVLLSAVSITAMETIARYEGIKQFLLNLGFNLDYTVPKLRDFSEKYVESILQVAYHWNLPLEPIMEHFGVYHPAVKRFQPIGSAGLVTPDMALDSFKAALLNPLNYPSLLPAPATLFPLNSLKRPAPEQLHPEKPAKEPGITSELIEFISLRQSGRRYSRSANSPFKH